MRRFLAVIVVSLMVFAIMAVASCSGKGGRSFYAPPPGFIFGTYYPDVEEAHSVVGLTLVSADQSPTGTAEAIYAAENPLGAFDEEASLGGFAIVNNETYFRIFDFGTGEYFDGLQSLDPNGDGYADSVDITMRWLPADAVRTPYASGWALVGGADYLPHALFVGNFVFYLPINQQFVNSNLVIATWNGDSWSAFGGSFSVVPHPLDAYRSYYVVEIRDYTGNLTAFGVFAPVHTGGTGVAD